jgi:hypothetical protein
VAAAGGAATRAATRQRESLANWRALGDAVGASHALDEIAQGAAAAGRPQQAGRLFGAAAALRERAVGASWLLWRGTRDRALAAVRAALGADAFAAAWAAGQALTLEGALAEAERSAVADRTGPPAVAPPPTAGAGSAVPERPDAAAGPAGPRRSLVAGRAAAQ